MKTKIDTLNLKGKVDIRGEYVKNSIDIKEEELTWSEFDILFRRKKVFVINIPLSLEICTTNITHPFL